MYAGCGRTSERFQISCDEDASSQIPLTQSCFMFYLNLVDSKSTYAAPPSRHLAFFRRTKRCHTRTHETTANLSLLPFYSRTKTCKMLNTTLTQNVSASPAKKRSASIIGSFPLPTSEFTRLSIGCLSEVSEFMIINENPHDVS